MKRKKVGKLLFIGIVVSTLVVPVHASPIKDAKDKKQAIQENKSEAEADVKALQKEQQALKKSIEALDKKMQKLDERFYALSEELKQANIDLKQIQTELEQAKEDEKIQYATMKKRIKYMYEHGETGYLEVIFQADSLSELLNRTEYVAKISEYDHNMLERLKAVRQKIAKAEKKQEEEIVKVTKLKAKVKEQKEEVEKLAKQKQSQMKQYEANIKKKKSLIASYEKQLDAQDALIEKLEEEARRKAREEEERRRREQQQQQQSQNHSSNNPSSNDSNDSHENRYTGGAFSWPCPASHTVTSQYGYRIHPIIGTRKLHNGIDIGASYGSSIVAASGGTVISASYNGSMGNYVMIDHGSGITTVYMHCSRLSVSSGQKVSKGQQIANVGSTGMSTGPHLHFSVMKNGSYVSPWNYLN